MVKHAPTATIAVVIAALAALVARQAVQRAIDRLLYGRRGDPMAVFGSVARRLESAGTPEGLLTDVVGDLRQALKLDDVAIYAVDGKLLAGTPGSEAGTRLSLAHQGELVGELRVWTARGDVLKPGDLRLLQDDLGPQLAVAIEAVRLKRDLQHARERLVVALEDERRRLRHDLHDGLGPTLTAITLRADAATNLLARRILLVHGSCSTSFVARRATRSPRSGSWSMDSGPWRWMSSAWWAPSASRASALIGPIWPARTS